MTWFEASSVSVTNGSKIVTVNTGDDIAMINGGDALILAGQIVEIDRAYLDGATAKKILLIRDWSAGNQTAQPARVAPIPAADLRRATEALRAVGMDAVTFSEALAQLITSTADTITIETETAGDIVTVPYGKMTADYASKISTITAAAQDGYRKAVEAASGGKNSVFWDAQGNPNIMVWINKFNCEDVNAAILARHGVDLQLGTGVHPAFIKNGVQMRGFWYGKYQASAGIGGGCSVIAGVQPRVALNYDVARALCVNKGPRWHMASNAEWAAVSFLNLAYGNEARGNTNYGRSHSEKHETARRSDNLASGDTAGTARTDTGTGPAAWSHDGTSFGVFDMVGNVWEWVDQLLVKEGQVFIPSDNNPDLAESSWPSHEVYLDSSGPTGGSVVLNSLIENRLGTEGDSANAGNTASNTWATTAKSATYVPSAFMRQMAIESASATGNLGGTMYIRNYGERAPYRGGGWSFGAFAGLGALYLHNSRTNASSNIGFRPALFEE